MTSEETKPEPIMPPGLAALIDTTCREAGISPSAFLARVLQSIIDGGLQRLPSTQEAAHD